MKKSFIIVVLAGMVVATAYGGYFALTRDSNGEAQLTSPTTTTVLPDSTEAVSGSDLAPAVTAAPSAQLLPVTTTSLPAEPSAGAQPMDAHCLSLMLLAFPETETPAVDIGNTSYSVFGAAAEYLNPGEQIELVSAKGDTGCVIAKTIFDSETENADPSGQPIDNYCYQTTTRMGSPAASIVTTSNPDGSATIETTRMVAAIKDMKQDGETLIFADSAWNIGCAYIKNGSIKQLASVSPAVQPVDRYCMEIFKAVALNRTRTFTFLSPTGAELDTDFYSLLGEAIARWETGDSVTLSAGLNGQSGCILQKTAIDKIATVEPAKTAEPQPETASAEPRSEPVSELAENSELLELEPIQQPEAQLG